MNVRQVAFLLFASVGLWSISATIDAQQLQIRGPKSNTAELSGTTYGPIAPEDTLWRIASRYRQNKNLSVYQVMLAIYQLNPNAFEDQNFNHLVDGSILKLPSERYVARIDPQQAQQKAEQDDSAWQAFSKGETTKVVVNKPKEAASKDDLTETKQVIEDKLTALDAEQNRQFSAIRQQFAESIDSVQTLLNENRKLVDRLDLVDTEISSLRGRVDEELQVQMDQMLALQNELLAISREAEAQRKAEMQSNSFAWLTDPLFLIFLSMLFTISLIGALAMWLIRRNRSETTTNSILDENHAAVLEQSDEMDDLADALTNELSEELGDDDDDLFGDDDLLDDVLSDELEESLDSDTDEELEAFDELGDESLDPVIEEVTAEEENKDGVLDQDDLDNLFDEEDLLADIGDDLDDLDSDIDTELDSALEQESDESKQDDDLDPILAEDAIETADSKNGKVKDDVSPEKVDETFDEAQSDTSAPTISPVSIDDEPDKPEISIDELLEQPQQDELPDSVTAENPDLMNEEMLQNIDKEIQQQNEQLDNITDELLNEIEQLEQMGGMLEEEPETADDTETGESQMGIQELDSLSENIDEDDVDENDSGEVEIADELFDSVEPIEPEVDNQDENSPDKAATETSEDQQSNVDVDDIDALLDQQNIQNNSVESLSADELLKELEGDTLDSDSESEVESEPEAELAAEKVEDFPQDEQSVDSENAVSEAQEISDSDEKDSEVQLPKQPDEEQVSDTEAETDGVEDLDKALEEFEQEVVSEATNFDVELDDESPSLKDQSLEDVQLEQIIPPEKDDDVEKVVSDFDEDIPSLDDIDSLSGAESDDFDDDDLDEALKAFDESYLDQQDEQHEEQASTKRENFELDDLPGLGDWLSSEEAEESNSLDDLENTSFDDLLDSIDSSDDEAQTSKQPEEKESTVHLDSGLDFDALLNDIDDSPEQTKDKQKPQTDSEKGFLDVDDLINESIEAEGSLEIDKELNLAAAFESYKGFGEAGQVDVDSDKGIGAKLDLAQAYLETDDILSAKELLEEVMLKGDDMQREEAKELLDKLS